MKRNIAIDGPSAAGKSTIARLCAKELGYKHLDTGAMYRCVGYLSKLKGIAVDDELALADMMDQMKLDVDSAGHIYLTNQEVSSEIRTNEMSMRASDVSKLKMVRERLVTLQQQIASAGGYVLDGRDIGTVVLPDAMLKIFLVASVKARAQRRIKEYIEKNIPFDEQEVIRDIEVRDYQDTHRENSPLKKAADAIEIDTSDMSIEEVIDEIRGLLKTKSNEEG